MDWCSNVGNRKKTLCLSSKPLRYSIISPFLNNNTCFPSSIALHTIAHSFNAAAEEMKFESNVLSIDDNDDSFFLYFKFDDDELDEGGIDDDDAEEAATSAAAAVDITIVLGDILFSNKIKGEENI